MVIPEITVVIPVRDRHHLTRDLIADLDVSPDSILVIDNNSEEPAREALKGLCQVIEEPERNISRLWNVGLKATQGSLKTAILNNDLRVPPGFLDALAAPLRDHHYAISYPDWAGRLQPGERDVRTVAEAISLFECMSGYAFMMNRSKDLWMDESMIWWYSDRDIEWQARQAGGVVCVGGVSVEHLHPNVSTNSDPDLLRQTGLDRETFFRKWRMTPH